MSESVQENKISAFSAKDKLPLRRLLPPFEINSNSRAAPQYSQNTLNRTSLQGRSEQRVFAIDFFLLLGATRQDSRHALFRVLACHWRSIR